MLNKILITGNGFDLYHGLPTKYTDFLRFAKLWDIFIENYDSSTEKSDKDFIDVPLGEKGELTEETVVAFAKGIHLDEGVIKYLNEHLKSNVWITLFEDARVKDGWIDFELKMQEALAYIARFYRAYLPGQDVRNASVAKDFKSKSMQSVIRAFGKKAGSEYIDYISGTASTSDLEFEVLEKQEQLLVNAAKEEMNALIECLKYYLRDFVSQMEIKVKSEQVEEIGACNVLNFNYTYTYRRLYKSNQREEGQYHEIHGEIKEDDMVLGIDDDAFDKDLRFVYFAKYFQRIQKRTGSFYREWISEKFTDLESVPVEIFVVGHSLGVSDRSIIRELFMHRNVGEITIFYHDQIAYENQVINLVEIFGKEYVIDQTGKGRIKFVQLKKAVKL